MSVFDEIQLKVAEIRGIPTEAVKADSDFIEDLESDSLDIVEILMAVEDLYDLEVPEEAGEKMRTVQDLVDFIVQHKQ